MKPVWIVDDDRSIRWVIEKALSREGIAFNSFSSAQDALDALSSYNWPGNIRELENEIQRIVIQSESGHWIEVTDLSPRLRKIEGTVTRIARKQGTLKELMEQVERWLIAEALRDHGNNKTKTAATLGITREGLHKKLAKFGV